MREACDVGREEGPRGMRKRKVLHGAFGGGSFDLAPSTIRAGIVSSKLVG